MPDDLLTKIKTNLEKGMKLRKCHQCGCMINALDKVDTTFKVNGPKKLYEKIQEYEKKLVPQKYSCLGCKYCYGAEAENALSDLYPDNKIQLEITSPLITNWPPLAGEYFTFCDGKSCPVAVSTLGSTELVEKLRIDPEEGLCIVGKTETENIGIDKIIKNTISNPSIQVLLITGKDTQGHFPGKSLIALAENGVDENMRIIGSPGRRPILKNVTSKEVKQFRHQIKIEDMIDCEDDVLIRKKIKELSVPHCSDTCSCREETRIQSDSLVNINLTPIITAKINQKIKLDKKGYFVIIPDKNKKEITVEYYSNDNTLLGIMKGKTSRDIYLTIIEKEWISSLSHAAYLGKELARAELAIKSDLNYIQDGA